jgi:hypothetical protein
VVVALSGGASVACPCTCASGGWRTDRGWAGSPSTSFAWADATGVWRGSRRTLLRVSSPTRLAFPSRRARERASALNASVARSRTPRAARHALFDRARVRFYADVVAVGQGATTRLRRSHALAARAGPRAGGDAPAGTLSSARSSTAGATTSAYLGERRIRHVEDESNGDVGIPRNRVRAELLPLLSALPTRRRRCALLTSRAGARSDVDGGADRERTDASAMTVSQARGAAGPRARACSSGPCTAGDLDSHDGCGWGPPRVVPARRRGSSAHPNLERRCAREPSRR